MSYEPTTTTDPAVGETADVAEFLDRAVRSLVGKRNITDAYVWLVNALALDHPDVAESLAVKAAHGARR